MAQVLVNSNPTMILTILRIILNGYSYFTVNGVEEDKLVAHLLSELGMKTYAVLYKELDSTHSTIRLFPGTNQ